MERRAETSLLPAVADRIVALRRRTHPARAVLVGLSGIDASGKGFLAAKLESRLRKAGLNVALVGVDGWLNLPHVRFCTVQPGRHFYEHGFRFAVMFDQLVLPLRDRRSIHLEMDYAKETARQYQRHRYEFHGVDVVLIEGICLFKLELRRHFDLACWVDCSFDTAIERAILRGQGGLPPDDTVRAFETVYWPAQRLHFARDEPREGADVIINNDPALGRKRTFPV